MCVAGYREVPGIGCMDDSAPTLVLKGPAQLTMKQCDKYVESGVEVVDANSENDDRFEGGDTRRSGARSYDWECVIACFSGFSSSVGEVVNAINATEKSIAGVVYLSSKVPRLRLWGLSFRRSSRCVCLPGTYALWVCFPRNNRACTNNIVPPPCTDGQYVVNIQERGRNLLQASRALRL